MMSVTSAPITPATPPKTGAHVGRAAAHAHHSMIPHWITHLGPLGLFAVAAIDGSPIPLAIPGSTDLLLLLLVSHRGNPFLLTASAVIGSAIGAYTTWSAGKRGGEALLRRTVSQRMRERIEHWTDRHSILAVFLPAVLPPPIPLMPFLVAAGALGVSRRRFFVAFNLGRTLRYGLVAWAGVVYGRRFVRWWTNTLAGWSTVILWAFILALVGGIAYGIWQYRRQQKTDAEAGAFV
jgi:membrane protein YqaA with SNARE-associated domain